MNPRIKSNPESIRLSKRANPAITYGNLKKFLEVFLCLLLLAPPGSSAQFSAQPDAEQLEWLGQQIFRNECNNRHACLTAWNEGENFPSLGIGHFIWYRAGQQEIYTESFPDLLKFMQSEGVLLPAWIIAADFEQPWASRAEFLAAQNDGRMLELRQLLADQIKLQIAFIVSRFNLALERLLYAAPPAERQTLRDRFNAVAQAQAPYGLYALIDYVHFKGEGINQAERYNGKGWGLLQVLQGMPATTSAPLEEFVASADNILARRVSNAPPERLEQRWLAGWSKRLATYLPASAEAATQE